MDLNADEDIRTIWCGNLSTRITEEILYELFLQVCRFMYLRKQTFPNNIYYSLTF